MAWLLDTNILSALRRLRPEPKVLEFVAVHPLDELYISAVTLAELRFGIELLSEDSNRRVDLNNWLTSRIRPMFDKRVWPVTEEHFAQMAACCGRRPESWSHLFTARPDYRRHCASSRPYDGYS
jgi:predicted nucleic acid-binding protein